MAILSSMPTTTVKATYSLDRETVRTLERLAQRLELSKSEVLRRAIRCLADEAPEAGTIELGALGELQDRLSLSEGDAEAWAERVRRERSTSRRG